MKKTIFNKKSATVAMVGAIAITMIGSMAYFTDYATTSVTGTAGTVAIAMDSDINLLDAEGRDILNPGDMRDGSFGITNMGNKSIDVRTIVALTALDHNGDPINFTGSATEQSEYDLYLASDVELVEGEGYKPVAGATPLEVKSIDGNVITYVLPEYSLNGNSDEYNEVETVDGVDAFSADNNFVLVFKGAAGNEWQASSVQLDVVVEAKQHENTQAGWEIVAQESLTHGSINKDVVKAENVITENDGVAEDDDMGDAGEIEDTMVFRGLFEMTGADLSQTTMTFTNNADPTDEIVVTVDRNGSFIVEGLKANAEYNLAIAGKMSAPMSVPFKLQYTVETGSDDAHYDIKGVVGQDGTTIVL